MKQYYVYVMANVGCTIYVGVTNNIERRVYEHKHKLVEGFTSRYGLTNLVYMPRRTAFGKLLHVRSRSKRGHVPRNWRSFGR